MKINIKKRGSSYPTIAMADIAFLLLIFLIVTVSIDDNGEIEIPFFKNSKPITNICDISIKIDQSENIIYNEIKFNIDEIKNNFTGFEYDKTIIKITADRTIPYITVDKVINAFHQLGFNKIILATTDEQ